MSTENGYVRWTLEEAALDAALTNAAQAALHRINRGGLGQLERIARTDPQQFVAIGSLDQIAELVTQQRQARRNDGRASLPPLAQR